MKISKKKLAVLEGKLQVATGEAVERRTVNERLTLDITRLNQTVADKNAAIARLGEDVERQKKTVERADAERDRIVRIVDQFLSVSITPHANAGSNSPADLRTLKKV